MSTPGDRPPPKDPHVHIHSESSGHSTTYIVGKGTLTIEQAPADRGRVGVAVDPVPAADAAAPGVFVGRDAQVEQLLGLIDPGARGSAVAVVSAVAGLAGVGKTTLARHVAQVAVGRGWFPGGAVLVDLHGYDPAGRALPGQVFAPLLRALGVPTEQIPPVVDEQAVVYRQVLAHHAEQNRPVLVVLDNASTIDQLTGLLPTHRAHRALVTSRHTLSIDGARIIEVDVLGEPAAVDLLDRTLRERHPDDSRAVDQHQDARGLARLCGRLPLALRIVAGLAADTPARPLDRLVADLTDTHTRLGGMVHGERAVTAAFDLSWQHLSTHDPGAARLFRLLPVNPGRDICVQAAAALADEPPALAAQRLRVLRWAHLIDTDPAGQRWRMHDLVRLYATYLSSDDHDPHERDTAIRRLLDHYTSTADAADDHLSALPGCPVPDQFTDRDQALEWLDAERANLVAAVDLAAATGRSGITLRLAVVLSQFLRLRRYLDDWVATASTALGAARHITGPYDHAVAFANLGMALQEVRRFDEAITAHQRCLDIFQKAGDQSGEGMAWGKLGSALRGVRRFDEAITAHQRAIDIYQRTGDYRAEGAALGNLGAALAEARRVEEAITTLQRAAEIHRETGDRHSEGSALNNLGAALQEMGKFGEATTALRRAAEICRETGDRHSEGTALGNLAMVLTRLRRFDEAITAHQQDLAICQETGDRHGEGVAWNNLGVTFAGARRFEEAITTLQRAAEIHRETGDRHGEGNALRNLGLYLVEVQRFDDAITALKQAVEAYTETRATEYAENVHRLIEAIENDSDPQDQPQP